MREVDPTCLWRLKSPHNSFINILLSHKKVEPFENLGNFCNGHNRTLAINYFCLFPLQTHYKITVLKIFPLYWLKNLPTFFAVHSTHQRAQHNEGTERHDARHVTKLLSPNYQNVRLCTALLACKTFLAWSFWRLSVMFHEDN